MKFYTSYVREVWVKKKLIWLCSLSQMSCGYVEDKVRKRATERDAIRNGRSVMFMNSLRILRERRLAARTVMNKIEVQRREEEEEQINRDLAYERARIKWVESIWNQVEEKKGKAMRRCGKEETRRKVQSELFQ